jgi:hypothetical protein
VSGAVWWGFFGTFGCMAIVTYIVTFTIVFVASIRGQ